PTDIYTLSLHDALPISRSRPSASASSLSPSSTPVEGSSGVEGTLARVVAPKSSTATRSVNVPPTSMPMRYTMSGPLTLTRLAALGTLSRNAGEGGLAPTLPSSPCGGGSGWGLVGEGRTARAGNEPVCDIGG